MTRAIVTMLGMTMLAGCGSAQDWPERTVRVALEAPNPCWRIAITDIYQDGDGLLVVSRLQPPDPGQMCAQVISTISHQVTLPLPEGEVTYLVLGRSWEWGDTGPGYEFLSSPGALEQRLANAELLYEVARDQGERDAGGSVE